MNQQAVAIGPWILRCLQALVTDMKNGVFVLCPWTREDSRFCREHNEHYIRWVRFEGGEIPRSENGCVEGSFLYPRAENREEPEVREHE
jgi:hypothetical protein